MFAALGVAAAAAERGTSDPGTIELAVAARGLTITCTAPLAEGCVCVPPVPVPTLEPDSKCDLSAAAWLYSAMENSITVKAPIVRWPNKEAMRIRGNI